MRLAALSSFSEEKSLLYISDSLTYLQVAQNVISHGVFSMEIMTNAPHPDNFRTPLYPLFLIPFVLAKTSLYTIVIVQNILFAAAMVGFYLLSRRLVSDQVAAIATILFSLEPMTALISSQIMTEPLFTSLFVIGILLLALAVKEKNQRFILIAAAILGLSALAKPVALYIAVVIIPLTAVFMNIKKYWKSALLGWAIFFITITPWIYYSLFIIKTHEFSSLGSFDLYAYHATYFDAWRADHGALTTDRLPELDLMMVNRTFDARPIALLKSTGLHYIQAHFSEYLFYHILRLPQLYTDSGASNILNGLPFIPHFDLVQGKYFYEFDPLRPLAIFQQFAKQPALLILFFADTLFILITILAFLQPVIFYQKKKVWNIPLLIIIAVLIGYTILASPIGGARLRIPVNFFLFLLATDTVFIWWRNRNKLSEYTVL